MGSHDNTFIVDTPCGNSYDCIFTPENNLVEIVGPLPKETVGSRGPIMTLEAKSFEDARAKVDAAIRNGQLK